MRALRGLSYAETAVRVMTPFIAGDFAQAELGSMTDEAYSRFRHAATAPQPFRFGAASRADIGVQGFRHAVAGQGYE